MIPDRAIRGLALDGRNGEFFFESDDRSGCRARPDLK
jgi:hypothetical protein